MNRQPFPGPGLAIRIIGEVTPEKLDTLRACDWVVIDEVKNANLYHQLWQSFAVLTDSKSVGVMGDYRTYNHVVAIRAVSSEDAMTADWVRLPVRRARPRSPTESSTRCPESTGWSTTSPASRRVP